jgi:hypothetical protein
MNSKLGVTQDDVEAAQVDKMTNESAVTSADELPTRLLKKIIGRQVEQAIVDADEHVLLRSGDVVTPDAVARARAAGVLRQLLNSATEECCITRTASCTRADIW